MILQNDRKGKVMEKGDSTSEIRFTNIDNIDVWLSGTGRRDPQGFLSSFCITEFSLLYS